MKITIKGGDFSTAQQLQKLVELLLGYETVLGAWEDKTYTIRTKEGSEK